MVKTDHAIGSSPSMEKTPFTTNHSFANVKPGLVSHQITTVKPNLHDHFSHQQHFAEEIVDVIKEVIVEEVKKNVPSYVLCEVLADKGNSHYDVYVVPDTENILHNIPNGTTYSLKQGDMVYVCKIDNTFANAYIASKIVPFADKKRARVNMAEASLQTSIQDNYLSYKNGRWFLVFSDDFYDNLLKKYSKIRVGISRVLCQKSSAGRAKFFSRSKMIKKPSRFKYSLPESIGVQRMANGEAGRYGVREYYASPTPMKQKRKDPEHPGKWIFVTIPGQYRIYPIIDQVKTSETFEVPTRVGTQHPQIEVTNIINNFIFMDDYNVRRSWRGNRGTKNDCIRKQFKNYGYWFKRFGIFIKGCDGNNTLLYVTPQYSTIEVRSHALDVIDGNNYRRYNLSNVAVLATTVISLQGEFTGYVYMPPGYNSLEDHGPYYIPDPKHPHETSCIEIENVMVNEDDVKPGKPIHIYSYFHDWGEEWRQRKLEWQLNRNRHELIINPTPGYKDTWQAGVTYTITYPGVETLTVTVPDWPLRE